MSCWALTGCLYSVHHFNTGVILPAGKTQTTLGVGRQPLWHCDGPSPGRGAVDSTAGTHACGDSAGETVSTNSVVKASLGFRLGLSDKVGPFPGAELEWHLEGPTSPATMEFAVNVGLPAGTSYHHKVGAGWGIGAWADNSFFMEYAGSTDWGPRVRPFGNLRATYLATQIGEVLGEDFAAPLPSHQHFVYQAAAGLFIRLPDWIVVPDFIIPEINATFPQVPGGEGKFHEKDIPQLQWDLNLGLGWAF